MIKLQELIEAAKIVGKIDLPQPKEDKKNGITKQELKELEKVLDALFKHVGLDVEFTKHMFERINNDRNGKPITVQELMSLFQKTYQKYSEVLSKANVDWQAVLKDTNSKINLPFVINFDKKEGLQLVAKTIMRKDDFKSSNPFLKV